MITRFDDWPQRLDAGIAAWSARPLQYGTADCFQFVGAMVLALTGVDHRDHFPSYASREEAEAILKAHRGPAGILVECLGRSKPAAWANRGDLVIADFHDGWAPGVCVGINCCTVGPTGLVFQRTLNARAAWSV